VTLAMITGDSWDRLATQSERAPAALPALAVTTTGIVFAQLVLGALVRHMHAGLAIPDFPLAFGRVIPPLVTPFITVHFAHRVGALVVATAVVTTLVTARRAPSPLRRPALLAALLVALQVTLGASVIWTGRAVVPTTTHLVTGAALLATCLVLALRAARMATARSAAVEPAAPLQQGILA
jgi:cytochrome c oxidase assembly protein subunit 15